MTHNQKNVLIKDMKTNDIKKGTQVRLEGYGNTTCTVVDNRKGVRRQVAVKGSEVGLFDETGDMWSHKILEAKVNGSWIKVEHTKKQLEVKRMWG